MLLHSFHNSCILKLSYGKGVVKSMATLSEIAKEADVSLATVSRVINKSFRVSDEKRERVLAAMESLGYQYTTKNKINKSGENRLILVIASIHSSELSDAMQETSKELGYNVLYNYIADKEDGFETALDTLKQFPENFISGIITINSVYKNEMLKDALSQYPLVQIGEPLNMPETNYIVSTDDVQAAYDLTEHLIKQGKKKIAIMTIKSSATKSMGFVDNREYGFMKALRDYGLPFKEEYLIYSDYSVDGGAYASSKILKMEEKPDAVLCVSDTMALGCIYTFTRNGVRVPEDIAVCGFDNIDFFEYANPPLTSVDISWGELGIEALKMLDSIINQTLTTGRKLYVPHKIFMRESTVKK